MNSLKSKFLALITAIALVVTALLGASPANAASESGEQPGQSTADDSHSGVGGWADSDTKKSGRPFITEFKVNDVSQLTAPQSSPDDSNWKGASGTLSATVEAFNVCGTSKTPPCYSDPNRIGITIGLGTDPIVTNLAHSSASAAGVTESTVFDLTINLNGFKSKLGWTWLNGAPSFWKYDSTAGTIRVKFSPRYMPSTAAMGGTSCTTIPVSTCDVDQATAEMLRATMVVSVDTTASLFAGTLFASENAVIGSLDIPSGFNISASTTNYLTYGISSAHKFASDFTPAGGSAGDVRKGKFYGLVPNSLLSSAFGLTDPSQASSLMQISRQSDTSATGADTVAWSTWTIDTNGTAGQFVTISDITFSAPKFNMKRTAVVKKGKKRTKKQLLSDVGLTLAKGESFTVKVAKSSRRYCSVSGTSIKGKKAGICSYTVVVKKKKKAVTGKTKSGSLSIS